MHSFRLHYIGTSSILFETFERYMNKNISISIAFLKYFNNEFVSNILESYFMFFFVCITLKFDQCAMPCGCTGSFVLCHKIDISIRIMSQPYYINFGFNVDDLTTCLTSVILLFLLFLSLSIFICLFPFFDSFSISKHHFKRDSSRQNQYNLITLRFSSLQIKRWSIYNMLSILCTIDFT